MKLHFAATLRNREAILDVLRTRLAPPVSRVFEVASGSGEHAAYFAEHLPWLRWQTSDPDADHRRSIDAWAAPGSAPALEFSATDPFPPGPWDAVFCANLVHIAPWAVAEGLFRGAAAALRPGGLLVTYGPYSVDGRPTSASNESFDASLKARDPRWGVRDVAALAAISPEFAAPERSVMPANNFVLVFRRVG